MTLPSSQIKSVLHNPQEYKLEPYVEHFLRIWIKIHDLAKETSLDDVLRISRRILVDDVLPFYEKFKHDPSLRLVEPWLKTHASIHLRWKDRGGYMMPLQLITYEVCCHPKSVIHVILQGIYTKRIPGRKEVIFEHLLPVLTNFIVPLDKIDIALLRANLQLERDPNNLFMDFYPYRDYIGLEKRSIKTISRRIKRLRLLDMVAVQHVLDMGQLGYETSLIVHTGGFPERFLDVLLMNANMSVGTFSLVQIPFKETQILHTIQEQLPDSLVYPVNQRVINWNLSGLVGGEDPWQIPPSLIYGEPQVKITSPSPRFNCPLAVQHQSFKLTPADVKILDFLSTMGDLENLTHLSQATGVSTSTISQRLPEYAKHQITTRLSQFFNFGLDLSIYFYLSTEDSSIPWLDHFLTFPKVDVFISKTRPTHTYFGFLKLPNKWIKPFARNMDRILEGQREANMKLYWKINTVRDHFKWGISLLKTYHHLQEEE
ncbi:MAG: hypothetical protein ACFFFG_11815 [Candidatus Thorarchaeota archaeon]